jgi:predicted ATP-grasp superfamily ATP-dependent carboligase
MQVFVYEHLSSCSLPDAAGPSLRREGWAMLSAVLEDFAGCSGVQVVTLIDAELASAAAGWPEGIRPTIRQPGDEEAQFRTLAATSDFALVIAPEFEDRLAERCRWAEEEGSRLLGPSLATICLTADKLTLARHLQDAGVPTPSTVSYQVHQLPDWPWPLVCKPRFGAGSQATFLVHKESELEGGIEQARREGWTGEMILQPYSPGLAVSVAFLRGVGIQLALPAVVQRLSGDGRFRYLGGKLPLPRSLEERAIRVAERAVAVVPGLEGYFGLDLVLGDNPDGSDDWVVEINPRLTTSYVALRKLACFNLAETLLAVVRRTPLPPWGWRSNRLEFTADGQVQG